MVEEEVTEDAIKEWFNGKKETISKQKIRMELLEERFSRNDTSASACWTAMFAKVMFTWLEEIYEHLEVLHIGLLEKETETSDYNSKLEKLKRTIKNHEPILKKIDDAFAQTDNWLKKGK